MPVTEDFDELIAQGRNLSEIKVRRNTSQPLAASKGFASRS